MATQPPVQNYLAVADIHYIPPGSPMGTRPQLIKKGTVIASGVLSPRDMQAMLQNGHLKASSSAATMAATLTAAAPLPAAPVAVEAPAEVLAPRASDEAK